MAVEGSCQPLAIGHQPSAKIGVCFLARLSLSLFGTFRALCAPGSPFFMANLGHLTCNHLDQKFSSSQTLFSMVIWVKAKWRPSGEE